MEVNTGPFSEAGPHRREEDQELEGKREQTEGDWAARSAQGASMGRHIFGVTQGTHSDLGTTGPDSDAPHNA